MDTFARGRVERSRAQLRWSCGIEPRWMKWHCLHCPRNNAINPTMGERAFNPTPNSSKAVKEKGPGLGTDRCNVSIGHAFCFMETLNRIATKL